MIADPKTPEEFFEGSDRGLAIFAAIAAVIGALGDVELRTSKSQIAFRRTKDFAYVWRPDRYLSTEVPVVISIPLPHKLESPRFKEIAHPSPKVWMHHLELSEAAQVDPELAAWLRTAFAAAE